MGEASSYLDVAASCVFASDIDATCRENYRLNFGLEPVGDITKIDPIEIPAHDLLFAGFPCQPFSIIGQMKGFEDTRGTLFFHIANILKVRSPRAFVLENVKMLRGHDGGRTLKVILKTLQDLGYSVKLSVLNALDYGLPQKRERLIIVGHKIDGFEFQFPEPQESYKPLSELLEKKVDPKYFASDYIREKRISSHKPAHKPAIWHENKSGNISSYPYSCALRASASYNYLLVDGLRRLTPREMFRLQGFPDTFRITPNEFQARKQAGNSVPVNLIRATLTNLLPALASAISPEYVPTEKRG